jgi:hypothetical protein
MYEVGYHRHHEAEHIRQDAAEHGRAEKLASYWISTR